MKLSKFINWQIHKAKKKTNSQIRYFNERVLPIFGINVNLKKVEVKGRTIFIRKGTPDLSVALSCFSGEFDNIKDIYPEDYNGVIVDAGGYIGTAAIVFSEIYPKAQILTIEPSLENFSILKKNISNYNNIKALHGALLASDKKNIILRNRKTGAWGYTVVENPRDRLDASVMGEVPAYRLSSLGVKIEDIGLLKLDIEGGEYDIMKNDSENLKIIPVILAELHDKIVEGCTELFYLFSKDRIVSIDDGEKYLSIKKDFSQNKN